MKEGGIPMRTVTLSRAALMTVGCVLALGACALGPSATKQKADALKGQNIQAAFAQFGETQNYTPRNAASDGSAGWEYVWHTVTGTDTREDFVQTGTEYAGQTIVGMAPGGNGVASTPILQDQYRPTGYYQQNEVWHGCMLFIRTDRNYVIEDSSAIGDGC